ncbi:two-component sensor histidine kinase [Actinocatenispora thailandica]|uniref:histidine kinase n=1 Tax=Actinocatenispora thailandica TaxID=227318 RepID=A0A7R7DTC6_9ACTN|nr:histidine kinase [Actinocatenispora thailandica]BCJ37405.1 two-component sensor histidine kinase [Actinocatenispora thailandica]
MIALPRIPGPWRRIGAAVWYVPLALALFVASLVPEFHHYGTRLGGVPTHRFDLWALLAVALQCLPLISRRRWPLASLALVSVGFALDQLRGYHTVAGTALPFALIGVGAALDRLRRTTVLAGSAGFVALAVALDRVGTGETVTEFAAFYLALALCWGIGAWWRTARLAEAERRDRVAADTRTAERIRIARELHDVVTHHVTAMVVQAEAARYLTAAPERLEETLGAVSDTGRRAITDLRHLLDLLDPEHDVEARTPTVGRLRTLVEQTRQAGQPVTFDEVGTPAESTGSADLVAYRVVQEALTNALKYAHGRRTVVRVHHGEREIGVLVTTDGPETPAADEATARPAAERVRVGTATVPAGSDGPRLPAGGATPGFPAGGRGLAGLRERVDVLGGEFDAGARSDGGFRVSARIPVGKAS